MKHKNLAVSILIVMTLFASSGQCGWVDDWISQKTVSNPGSFDSQKRGYATAGGVNMRWKQSNDFLVGASAPKYSSGCGGIDLFNGGVNFMKYEMLVTKLQQIMGPAAAAFAFDIALNTLCVPCANGMKAMESITSRLNQLQLDDCKAQQATVAVLKDTTGLGGPADTEAVTNFLVSTGAQNLYADVVGIGDQATTETVLNHDSISKHDLVAGCPTEIRNIFFTPGSLLGNLTQEKGMATGYVDLIRALVGDVEISPNLAYNYVAPCDENSPETITDFMYGDIFVRELTTNNCVPITSIIVNGTTYTSIAGYIRFELEGITQSMLNQAALTPNQEAFLVTIPGPIYMAIKTDIQGLGENASAATIAGNYVDFASAAYAVAIFNDLYTTIETVLSSAEYLIKNKEGTDTGVNQNTCQMKLKDGPFFTLLEMQKTIGKYKNAIGNNYNKKVQIFLANIQMGTTILTVEKEIINERTKRFKRDMQK